MTNSLGHACDCGRTFGSRNGRANHAKKCPEALARQEAFFAELERKARESLAQKNAE